MSDRLFRFCVVVLLAVYVGGSLYFDSLAAQNGRYMQYDKRGEYSPDGKNHMLNPPYRVIDTRTGLAHDPE